MFLCIIAYKRRISTEEGSIILLYRVMYHVKDFIIAYQQRIISIACEPTYCNEKFMYFINQYQN